MLGRAPIVDVRPLVLGGPRPAKATADGPLSARFGDVAPLVSVRSQNDR